MSTTSIRDKERAVSIGLLDQLQSENTSLRFQVEKLTLALRHASSGGGSSIESDEVKKLKVELDREKARREELEQRLRPASHHQPTSMVSRNAIELEIENLQRRLTETRLAMSQRGPTAGASTTAKAQVTSQQQQVANTTLVIPEESDRDDLTLIIRHLNERRVDRPFQQQHPQWQRGSEEVSDLDGRGPPSRDQDTRPLNKRRGKSSTKNSNVERLFQGLPTRTDSDQARRRR